MCLVLKPEAPLCQVLTLNIVTLVYMLFMQSQFWKREASRAGPRSDPARRSRSPGRLQGLRAPARGAPPAQVWMINHLDVDLGAPYDGIVERIKGFEEFEEYLGSTNKFCYYGACVLLLLLARAPPTRAARCFRCSAGAAARLASIVRLGALRNEAGRPERSTGGAGRRPPTLRCPRTF